MPVSGDSIMNSRDMSPNFLSNERNNDSVGLHSPNLVNAHYAPPSLVTASVEMIRTAFNDFPASKIGIAFNGGKDSVVMMDLIKRAVPASALSQCVVFSLDDAGEFDEMRKFREHYVENHFSGVKLINVSCGGNIKQGVTMIKEEYDIDAAFLGTRSCDPSAKWQKTAVAPTTAGWPTLLRICPVFNWSYHDVWTYIHREKVPFCKLYSEGFTSLGSTDCTNRNPNLCSSDGQFRPAWELNDPSSERHGRGASESSSSPSPHHK